MFDSRLEDAERLDKETRGASQNRKTHKDLHRAVNALLAQRQKPAACYFVPALQQ
jgi:hypothetical protein